MMKCENCPLDAVLPLLAVAVLENVIVIESPLASAKPRVTLNVDFFVSIRRDTV